MWNENLEIVNKESTGGADESDLDEEVVDEEIDMEQPPTARRLFHDAEPPTQESRADPLTQDSTTQPNESEVIAEGLPKGFIWNKDPHHVKPRKKSERIANQWRATLPKDGTGTSIAKPFTLSDEDEE